MLVIDDAGVTSRQKPANDLLSLDFSLFRDFYDSDNLPNI